MTTLEYRVQVSARARHPRLRLSARDGLVVVVPADFDQSRVPGIVHARRDWVESNTQRLAEQHKFLAPQPRVRPPERILLRVIGEEWVTHYRQTSRQSVTCVERTAQRLLVYGNVADEAATLDALRRWLSRKTREHLVPWLVRLAVDNATRIDAIVVRSQRTRWASCSPRSTISLNTRLMFLPEPLVRYVMLHELAHTVEMNHGRRFWATVAKMEPSYEVLDSELRDAWRFMPDWVTTR